MANKSRTIVTPECRLSFCHMTTAKEFIDKGKHTGKFSYITDLIIKPEDLDNFQMLDPTSGHVTKVNIGIALRGLALEAWGSEINPDTQKPWTVKEMFAGVASKG